MAWLELRRSSLVLAVSVLIGCTETIPVICDRDHACGAGYVCNAESHCVLVEDFDGGLDLAACSSDCDGGIDAGQDLAGSDLQPMCTQQTAATVCGPSEPICAADGGTCRVCLSSADDVVCASRSASSPRCEPSLGECVACRGDTQGSDCASATPVCDGTSHACRICKAHKECATFGAWPETDSASGICTTSGACATAGQVLFVDNRGSATCVASNPTRDGTLTHPFCEISEALVSPKPYILVRGSSQAYGSIVIPSAAPITLSIVGPGLRATPPATISPTAINTPGVILLGDGAHALDVTLDGVAVTGGAGATSGHGISCTGAAATTQTKLRVFRTVVHSNAVLGISATGCDVTLDQDIIGQLPSTMNNAGGGIALASCSYNITNTLVDRNGSATAETKAINLTGTGSSSNRIVNVTVADNLSQTVAAGIFCGETNQPTLFNVVAHGNTNGDQVSCTSIASSAFSGATGGNQSTTGCASGDLFVSPLTPNFNYTPKVPVGGTCTAVLADKGNAAGAPDHDLFASPRPQPTGSKPDIGAIEVP